MSIRPELLGLDYVTGAVPTPHGSIVVHLDRHEMTLELPTGVNRAEVSYTPSRENETVYLDGKATPTANVGRGKGSAVVSIVSPGKHTLESRYVY